MKFFVVSLAVFVLIVGSLAFEFKLETGSEGTVVKGDLQFGLGLLKNISNTKKRTVVLSPSALWSALVLFVEASKKNTRNSLLSVLHLNSDEAAMRAAFKISKALLEIHTPYVEAFSGLDVFMDINQAIHRRYQNTLQNYYGIKVRRFNFGNTQNTTKAINKCIKQTTKGFIKKSVKANYLKKAQLLITSSTHFKGQWKTPFNSSQTYKQPFRDMNDKIVNKVYMMSTKGQFRGKHMSNLRGLVLELPYGVEERVSMLVLKPDRGVSINEVIRNMEANGVNFIFNEISKLTKQDFTVRLPRFNTAMDFSLKDLMQQMGFKDDFTQGRANFGRAAKNLHSADIVHISQISVTENGTIGAAMAKTSSTKGNYSAQLLFDRPFLYFVVEKVSKLLIFAGIFTNNQ